MAITFESVSTFMGEHDYLVRGAGETFRVRIKRQASSAYELSICNGDTVRRNAAESVGLLRRSAPVKNADGVYTWSVSNEVLHAFNAWCAKQHADAETYLKEKYGDDCLEFLDPAPAPARRGDYCLETLTWFSTSF